MHVNPTARWAEENWSELRRYCCHELRSRLPQAHRTHDVEDLFSEWLVEFIDRGELDERIQSGSGISIRNVAHFCVRKSISRVRGYGCDAHMRTRGYITGTDRKKGICSKSSTECVERCLDEDGDLHYVDPQSTVERLETRDELRRVAAKVVARYDKQPQFVRCFGYLAEGLRRSEMNESEGQSTNATVTRLRSYLRESVAATA